MASGKGKANTTAKPPAGEGGKTAASTAKKAKASKSVAAAQQVPAPAAASRTRQVPHLLDVYRTKVSAALMAEFKYGNVMEVPRLTKVVVNMGLGQAVANPNLLKTAVDELSQIAGQRAVVTKAKKAIANFKLRQGLGIGCMVTLRRDRMWEFLHRLQSVAIPRIRDFKGMSAQGFDGHGNYTCGLREQTIFPEVVYEQVDLVKGMNITVATTAKTDAEGRSLLKLLGLPFRT